MHNSWETTYGLDQNSDDLALDLNLYTFSSLIKYQSRTNPNNEISHP